MSKPRHLVDEAAHEGLFTSLDEKLTGKINDIATQLSDELATKIPSLPLSVENGGTNASRADSARANLSVAPKPQTTVPGGAGNVVNFSTATSYAIPSGGTWEVRYLRVTSSGGLNQSAYLEIVPGGTVIGPSPGYYSIGWAWRIS